MLFVASREFLNMYMWGDSVHGGFIIGASDFGRISLSPGDIPSLV